MTKPSTLEFTGYKDWISRIKQRISGVRQHIILSANEQQIQLYHEIGQEIIERQTHFGWGTKVIEKISSDLKESFPDMRGFSSSNLKYMRHFAKECPRRQIGQQSADQLPWFHIVILLTKIKIAENREWYAIQCLTYGWSRDTLLKNIKNMLQERQGKALTNFDTRLPHNQAEIAKQVLKDPYHFDFLGLDTEAHERDIENALIRHITRFLLELGAGFAFLGRQYRLEVAGDEFFIDLLFYHTKLKCYVVVELKATEFKPEHAGQLNFYLSTIDAQLKTAEDKPTIGLLLCKYKNKLVAEYALSGIAKPMGVAEYELVKALPDPLDICLPSIEELEQALSSDDEAHKENA